MSAALSCESDEPPGSGLPGDAEEGVPQGLYVTAPAEDLTLEGFAEGGRADTMAPGPLLAMVLDTVAGPDGSGLAGLSDDQLIGFLSGTRRMASRLAWAQLAALAEFGSRPRRQDFAADEVAAAFHLSWLSAAGEIEYARTVARRLPVTFAALAAGRIDAVHVRIIEDVTSVLSDEDAALADAQLAAAAQGKTYAELRRAATRLVLKLDPGAARKRKEKARREARVRAFREQSGNAGISGREMPSVEVLASMQHVEDRARALRDAGMPGTWEELKVRATLDLLQERDPRPPPGEPFAASGEEASGPDGPGPRGPGPGGSDPGGSDPGGSDPSGSDPGDPGTGSPGTGGPRIGALITITVPHTALAGGPGPGGEVDGFGILDRADTRDLIAAAARHPATRWCLTTLHPDRTAAAHACAAGPRPWRSAQGPSGQGPPGPVTPRGLLDLLNITSLIPVIRGPCEHTAAEDRYRPSRKLQHLVKARNATCTAPGCGRRAARCDLDHTDPHDQGGRTCECNLAPLCRHHHRCKQAEGWQLEQPEPGVLVWHTPAGRTYTTTPTQYAA
ncbi:MAG TPA: DUF222 domain-containing protein [Streptosporangiaceae bacterium]|nr:DUF222 domain-containing protein [Streptosporangiaceae bacterium]